MSPYYLLTARVGIFADGQIGCMSAASCICPINAIDIVNMEK